MINKKIEKKLKIFTFKKSKKSAGIIIFIIIIIICLLYSCTNITYRDFGVNDIGNMASYLLVGTQNGDSTDETVDLVDLPDTLDYTDNNISNTDEAQESNALASEETPQTSVELNGNTNIFNISDISDTYDISETAVPDTTPEIPQITTQISQTTENNIPKFVKVTTVFPGIPAKFSSIPFPETLEMTDRMKQNIRSLSKSVSSKDFGGTPLYVLTTNAALFTPLITSSSDTVSDARNYRTSLVQTACNVKINSIEVPKDMLIEYIESRINAGEPVSDIICVPLDIQSALMQKGLLVNLKKIPFLNLNAEYYNQSAIESFTVNGNIYGLISDVTFNPSDIYTMFYNKSIVRKYNLNSPPELYSKNEWTYDNMFAMSKTLAASAANLDGEAESIESYGIGFNRENDDILNGLFISSGNKYFIKKNYGFPVLNFNNDTTVKIINMLANIFAPQSESEMSNYLDTNDENQTEAFKNGKILFSIAKLDILPDITNSNFDWGIMPLPSLVGSNNINNADNIISFTDNNAMCTAVLKGTQNSEACGVITEALSISSYKYFRELYISDQMFYCLRDVDSVKMLTGIVNGVTFNQYNTLSNVSAIYNATVGVIKNSANKYGEFAVLYENNKNILNDFFINSSTFGRR